MTKKMLWQHEVNYIRTIEGPDTWGLIRIEYKIKHGHKIYTLWCHPEDLKDIK